MAEKLRDYFWTPLDIAEEWCKEGEGVKKKANYISRKFKLILRQLGFSKEDIGFYKIRHTTGAGQNKGRSYIFGNGDNISAQLKELFDIFQETKISMTAEVRDKVKTILADILPVCRNIEEAVQLNYVSGSQSELLRLETLLNEISKLDIIKNPPDNKRIEKTSRKIQGIIEELNTIIPADIDRTAWLEIGRNYYQRRYRVESIVDAYYKEFTLE